MICNRSSNGKGVLVLGRVEDILITTTISFPTSNSDFALVTREIINGHRVRIDALRQSIIDPLGIGLDTAEPVIDSRLCTITPKSG